MAAKNPKSIRAGSEKSDTFQVFEHDAGWMASGRSVLHSGKLSFDRKTETFLASVREEKLLFPKMAKGKFTPGESPFDNDGRLKIDFLFLFALRELNHNNSPGRSFDPFRWSKRAVEHAIAESERERGEPLPEANQAHARQIAMSPLEFEAFVHRRLLRQLLGPGSGNTLRKYARWQDLIDEIEEVGIAQNYQRFLSALEKAAEATGGVPTKHDVKTIFNEGLSANQLGADTGFRSAMIRLKFEWLPIRKPGPK